MFETNDDKFQQVAKVWASRKFDVPVEDIQKVDFDLGIENDGFCETCWHEYPVIEIRLGNGVIRTEDQYSFGQIVQEIVAVAWEVDG